MIYEHVGIYFIMNLIVIQVKCDLTGKTKYVINDHNVVIINMLLSTQNYTDQCVRTLLSRFIKIFVCLDEKRMCLPDCINTVEATEVNITKSLDHKIIIYLVGDDAWYLQLDRVKILLAF